MRSRALFLLLAATTLTGAARAGTFTIDEHGARPRKFRITGLCAGIDHWLSPDVYQSGLFDKAGKSIKAGHSMEFGMEGSQTFLILETGWQSGEYMVIGDATNLDDVKLFPGASITGKQVWDMAARVWRTSEEFEQGGAIRPFQGQVLRLEGALARLFAYAASQGSSESASNVKVLTSAGAGYWWNVSTDHETSAEQDLAAGRATYLTPARQASAGMSPEQKHLLAALHEEITEGAREALAYYAKDDWRPEKTVAVLRTLIGELDQFRQDLTGEE